MRQVSAIVLTLVLLGIPMYSQQEPTKAPTGLPEIVPKRPECGLFLPERGERRDIARLVRADQFLDCERDGFPKHLAPPWKEAIEGEKKLGDACTYFQAKSAKAYPQAGYANLKLAGDRCRVNVMSVIFAEMIRGLAQPPK